MFVRQIPCKYIREMTKIIFVIGAVLTFGWVSNRRVESMIISYNNGLIPVDRV